MKPINITSLMKKYGPGYIAKSKTSGRVIAHAKKISTLFEKMKVSPNVVISWIPKLGKRYAFRLSL